MALRNSWCFSRHLDLVFGWVLRSEDFPGPRPPVDASSPSTRCLVELNVVVVGVIRRFLLESFSHTFLCRSNACGLKVRLQMVHGRSVDWLSSGYSDGSSGAGPGPIAASTVSDAITGYQHARAMMPPPLAGGGAVPPATAAATCATCCYCCGGGGGRCCCCCSGGGRADRGECWSSVRDPPAPYGSPYVGVLTQCWY